MAGVTGFGWSVLSFRSVTFTVPKLVKLIAGDPRIVTDDAVIAVEGWSAASMSSVLAPAPPSTWKEVACLIPAAATVTRSVPPAVVTLIAAPGGEADTPTVSLPPRVVTARVERPDTATGTFTVTTCDTDLLGSPTVMPTSASLARSTGVKAVAAVGSKGPRPYR